MAKRKPKKPKKPARGKAIVDAAEREKASRAELATRFKLQDTQVLHETPNVIYISIDGKLKRFERRQMMVYMPVD